MNDKQYVNSIGFTLDEEVGSCVSIRIGLTPVYLHGSSQAVRDLAAEINEAASKLERRLTQHEEVATSGS